MRVSIVGCDAVGKANLVAGMGWLQNTFTRRDSVKHGLWGRLFGGRHRAVLVDDEEGAE